MSVKILNLYMELCKKNNIAGTTEGLKRLHRLLKA